MATQRIPFRDKRTAAGWLFQLQGGPHVGLNLRFGHKLPNGDYVPLPEVVPFPDGATYLKHPMDDIDGHGWWCYVHDMNAGPVGLDGGET